MSPKQLEVIVDGGILSAILQVFTRYSANNPQFPVNDRSLFTGVPATGKSQVIGGPPRPNGPPDEEPWRVRPKFSVIDREIPIFRSIACTS